MNQIHDISHPYQAMINNMPEGFIYYKSISSSSNNLLNYKLIDVNKSFEVMLGASKAQLIDKDFSELSMLNDHTSIYFNSLLDKMQSSENSGQFEIYNPFNKKFHSFSVFHDNDKYFTALYRDITEMKTKEALLEYNEKYKYHFMLSTDLLLINDLKNNLIEYNPAWCSTLGYSNEEFEACTSWDLIHPDDLENTRRMYKLMLKGERTTNLEIRFRCKNGDYKCLQWNAYPDMERALAYAVVRDITSNKKMEEQLIQSEERWQFALEASGSGVWDCNLQTNETVYSALWKSMLGYEDHEISSAHSEWYSRIHPDDVQLVDKVHERYFRGETSNYVCEYRMMCRDGTYKWFLSRGKVIQWDKSGNPLRMTGIFTDITGLKELSEDYSKITQDYQIVFNGTQDAMFLVSADEDGKFRFIRLNNTHERLTGLKTQMVAGLTPYEVLGEETGKAVENNYIKCINKKLPIQYEEEVDLPAGRKIWQTLLSPVIRDNKVIYIVGSSRDITEQRAMEELKLKADKEIEKLNESIAHENLKNEFFANLSHEFRTPLNVIFASMQLIDYKIENCRDYLLIESMKKYLKSMKQNCFRLLRLVNNLIDITRIDAGYFDLNLENKNIVSIVEDITLSVAEYVENKSISLIFDTETEERIMAIDPDKIERIILNLLSNAVKFTKPGGEIILNLYEEHEKFYISVRDSGIGIPQDKLDIIFDRFTQVDKSLARRREGSGIGLALVKSLVELHEGGISVYSTEGEGSEFIIELPIRNAPESDNTHLEESIIESDTIERINIEFSDIYV